MCTERNGRTYDCNTCTCTDPRKYRPDGHDATATRIGGIYYYVCRHCGVDL